MGIQNLAGQTIGQYELQELLGLGGMGAVYRAIQPSLKRSVAIKILTPALAQQPGYLERFNREAETAAGLEHSHIVPIYDHGTENGTSYVVMRYLTGGTLADRMRRQRDEGLPIPSLGEIAELLDQLSSALDYAHKQGIVHRDIKPSNVMFDEHGNAYVVDFGIAKLIEATESLTGTGVSMGTPAYMAPEQWTGDAVGPSTDQYALGVMTYALCTGHPPFEGPTPYALMHKHLNEKPIPPHYQRTDLPQTAALVMERALAKAPDERYPTASDFAEAFRGAIEGSTGEQTGFFTVPVVPQPMAIGPLTPPSQPSGGALKTTVRRIKPMWALGIALGVVAVLIAVALILLLTGDPPPTDLAGEQTNIALSAIALNETRIALDGLALQQTQTALEVLSVQQTQVAVNATHTAEIQPPPPQTEGEALLLTATALSLLDEPAETETGTPTASATATQPPTETPTATLTLAPSSTPIAVLSPEPTWTPIPPPVGVTDTALIAPETVRNTVMVPAGCRAAGIPPPSLTSDDEVVVTWSWSASRYALLQDHIERARYEIDLDGRPLLDWRDHMGQPMRLGQLWSITWRYPVGRLAPGEHVISYRVAWTEPVYDGSRLYGPNTENPEEDGSCVFYVVELEAGAES